MGIIYVHGNNHYYYIFNNYVLISIICQEIDENLLVRPLHNYMAKEKIEIVARMSQKLMVIARYWRTIGKKFFWKEFSCKPTWMWASIMEDTQ